MGQSEWECSEQGSKNIEKMRFRLCLPIAPLYQTRLKMERVPNLSPFSRGENLLFADADGATTFADLTKLEDAMKDISAEGEVMCLNF